MARVHHNNVTGPGRTTVSLRKSSPFSRKLIIAGVTPLDPLSHSPSTSWTVPASRVKPPRGAIAGNSAAAFTSASTHELAYSKVNFSNAPISGLIEFVASDTSTGTLMNFGDPLGAAGLFLQLDATAGFYIQDQGGSGSTSRFSASGLGQLTTGKRYVLAFSLASSGSSPVCYLNAVAVSGSGTTAPGNNTTVGLQIGAQGSGGAANLNARVGVFAVWQRALTAAELKSLTANPYQIFSSPGSLMKGVHKSLPSRIGTLTKTLAAAAVSATGYVRNPIAGAASAPLASAGVAAGSQPTFSKWLADTAAIRCVLVEVDVNSNDTIVTRRLSTRQYATKPNDTPPNVGYEACIVGSIKYTEKIPLDGTASFSFGEIEVDDTGGRLDSWLDDVWANAPLRIYVGDVRWARWQFFQVLDGTVADLDSKNKDRLNLKVRDKMQRLNTPVTEAKVGGTGNSKDAVVPMTFGECHNVSPVLVDQFLLEYKFHAGYSERVIEVRDNGIPIECTPMLEKGSFRLLTKPLGALTASVQGEVATDGYKNTVASLIKRIVTTYGKAYDRFTEDDIDLTSFTLFEANNQQAVGTYLRDRTNVIQVCQDLASAAGASIVMSRLGKLRLIKIQLPASGAVFDIKPAHIVQSTLDISERPAVAAAVKIGYCKNWTVQSNLQSFIPAEHKELFAKEWLSQTASDAVIAAKYKLYEEPKEEDTLLLTGADAIKEAMRRLNLRRVQRTVYSFDGYAPLLELELGQAVTLTHGRYGLSAGKSGQVISLSPDWANSRVKVEVLV